MKIEKITLNNSVNNNKANYNKQNLANNNVSFKAKADVFTYHGNVLKKNGRKYTGSVQHLFADGTELVMEYSKGIIQRAKKLSSGNFVLTKFTPKGEEIITIAVPKKVLYEKEYKYSPLGELMQVNKNGKPIFEKEYQVDVNSPVPITKSINKGEIIEFFDLNNKKLSMAIPEKYIKSDFRYQDGVQIEIRYEINKDFYDKLFNDYQKGIDLPDNIPIMAKLTKIIAKNPNSETARTQVSIINELGKTQYTYALDKEGRLSFVTNYEYNKDAELINKVTEYPYSKETEIYDKDGLPVVTKLVSKETNETLCLITREFDPISRMQVAEKTTYNYPVEHIKTINIDKIDGEIQYSEYKIIHTDTNKEYTRIAKIRNQDSSIIEQKYFAPDKTEITEDEFVKANSR